MKNKFKKLWLVSSILLCFCMFCGFDENKPKVYDYAGLLSESEEATLQVRCVELANMYETEFIITTTSYANGLTAGEYATQFCFDNDFGYEDDIVDKSCVLYLIDMDNREVYMLLTGLANYYFEKEWDHITDTSVGYLKSGDYNGACLRFLSDCEEDGLKRYNKFQKKYRDKWENYPGNYDSFYEEYLYETVLANPLFDLGIAVVIALIVVRNMAASNKSKMEVNQNTYIDRSTYDMRREKDVYLHTTTVKRKRESSSGGGGSRSRGRSTGGGGKSF